MKTFLFSTGYYKGFYKANTEGYSLKYLKYWLGKSDDGKVQKNYNI